MVLIENFGNDVRSVSNTSRSVPGRAPMRIRVIPLALTATLVPESGEPPLAMSMAIRSGFESLMTLCFPRALPRSSMLVPTTATPVTWGMPVRCGEGLFCEPAAAGGASPTADTLRSTTTILSPFPLVR